MRACQRFADDCNGQLYNMMQREDGKKTQELAEASRSTAERQLIDSRVMKDVALDSKRIAEATRLDSSAMKTIGILTMIFLPGTAIAVSIPSNTKVVLSCIANLARDNL